MYTVCLVQAKLLYGGIFDPKVEKSHISVPDTIHQLMQF